MAEPRFRGGCACGAVTFVLVGGGAFAIEKAGPDAARVIAITACCLLILLMVVGMVMRARAKKRKSMEAARLGKGPSA